MMMMMSVVVVVMSIMMLVVDNAGVGDNHDEVDNDNLPKLI